jgi:hypothetical protein
VSTSQLGAVRAPLLRGELDEDMTRVVWPNGKRFAFTIFDDTDLASVANTRPVYDLLADLGFRTTKSVWTLRDDPAGQPEREGSSCEDPEYLAWILELQAQGFEIASHLVASGTSDRERTARGLARFRELFGDAMLTHSNHLTNREGIYHGPARLSVPQRWAYQAFMRMKRRPAIEGHLPHSPLFWGDLCRQHVKYVRNFVFPEINTLKACPEMPYHDPARPFVNYWFASSEGQTVDSFVATLSEANQDRLAVEGGACLMYTHLACGFYRNGRLNPRFEELMRRLAALDGWFVPVRTLLDHLLANRGARQLTRLQRTRLEWRWLGHKLRVGPT